MRGWNTRANELLRAGDGVGDFIAGEQRARFRSRSDWFGLEPHELGGAPTDVDGSIVPVAHEKMVNEAARGRGRKANSGACWPFARIDPESFRRGRLIARGVHDRRLDGAIDETADRNAGALILVLMFGHHQPKFECDSRADPVDLESLEIRVVESPGKRRLNLRKVHLRPDMHLYGGACKTRGSQRDGEGVRGRQTLIFDGEGRQIPFLVQQRGRDTLRCRSRLMPLPLSPSTPMPPHPTVGIARRLAVFAAILFIVTAAAAASSAWPMAIVLAITGSFLGWSARETFRSGAAVQLANTAFDRLTRGRTGEAEALLAQIPLAAQRGSVARAMALQRAIIALDRGELQTAVAQATLSIDGRTHLSTRDYEETQIAAGLALRSIANASLGHDDAARKDAALAESHDAAAPRGIARAGLARAIILARAGDVGALAKHFAERGHRLLEWLTPRERALMRALRRMARAPSKSVYREAARPTESTEEGHVAAWIAKLAPGAAAFAEEARQGKVAELRPLAGASAEGVRAVEGSRASGRKAGRGANRRPGLVGLLWVVLIVVYFAIQEGHSSPTAGLAFAAPLALLFFVGLFAIRMRAARRTSQRTLRAIRGAASTDQAAAITELRDIGKITFPLVAANAHLALAQTLEQRAEWDAVLVTCDAGLGRATTTRALRALSSDLLIPQLVESRALALAALGRRAEADAELVLMARDFPTFAYAARAQFRVRLVAAARAGDLSEAAEIARTRTLDLPLTFREETLADVVLAVTDGTSHEEQERLEAELRDDPELCAWLDTVAGGLRDRLRGVALTRVAVGDPIDAEGDAGSAEFALPGIVNRIL